MLPENHMDQQITPVLLDLLRKARRHTEIAPARPLSSQMKSGLQTVTLYFQQPIVFLGKNNKTQNLCYHGTGSDGSAREAIREQQQGASLLEQCHRQA